MIKSEPKYWLACSGGVDSVVLARILSKTKTDFGILHCNFHLRGEDSNGDEQFVRELAKELNVLIRVREFDTKRYGKEHKINTQLAARELRYTWFDEVIGEGGIVLIAHHFDDQLETFFLQLRRGGSLKGLAGMPEFREGYLRPLLKYTKAEILELAQRNNWKWREDISNSTNDYTRNWYRHEVLSFLEKNGFPMKEVVPLMHDFQRILKEIQNYPIVNELTIRDWLFSPIWIQQHILSEHHLGEYPSQEITRLANAFKGKRIGNEMMEVWNEGTKLVFTSTQTESSDFEVQIDMLDKRDVEFSTEYLFMDAKKIQGELTVRIWKEGDVFQPIGLNGKKKISKFLRDRKVPSHSKDKVMVLLDSRDEIIGVFNHGVSEKVKITIETERILRVGVR